MSKKLTKRTLKTKKSYQAANRYRQKLGLPKKGLLFYKLERSSRACHLIFWYSLLLSFQWVE